MADHCMHPPMWHIHAKDPETRACCWCGFLQHRAYISPPNHGPFFKGESRDWHWEPPSVGSQCDRAQVIK